jgi:iron complex outermembrane recepter protein
MRGLHRIMLVALAGVSASAFAAGDAWAEEQQADQPPASEREIFVYGTRIQDPLAVHVEDEIGEEDIAAYAQDTVGDLLGQIGEDLGEDEDEPVVMVNGQLATGVDEIADLPTEAVNRIQLLSPDAAARLGQRPGQRVVNVVLKRVHEQFTVNAEQAFATVGKGTSRNGSLSWSKIAGNDRTALVARVRDTDPLLEADRDLITRSAGVPYDLIGNVIPAPAFGGEIDPLLSAAAGQLASIAAVPAGVDRPTLQQFAAGAGAPNPGDLSRFRSLIGDQQSYALNGTLARRLKPGTTFTLNFRGDVSESARLSSAPSVLLRLPSASPFSPFGREVSIARFLPVGLEQLRKNITLDASAALNHRLGTWNLTARANYNRRESDSLSDRNTDIELLQAGVLAGTLNPFATLSPELLRIIRRDRSDTRADRANAQLVLTGPVVSLPAGPATATLRLGGELDRINSNSTFTGVAVTRRLSREELNGQANLDLPVFKSAPDEARLPGDLSINFTAGFREVSEVGMLKNYGTGANWRPVPQLTLRGSFNEEEVAPAIVSLGDPVEITPGVRFFDFIRDETVDVTIISGGNPNLPVEERQVLTLGANFRPTRTSRTNFTAEYRRTRSRNVVAGLPPLSAVVQSAFPERFIRDGLGRLVQVDSRPVAIARDERGQLRIGFNLSGGFGAALAAGRGRRLGAPAADIAPVADEDDDEDPRMPPPGPTARTWRYNLSLNHVWALSSTRLIRAGIPVIDLLNGGAIGFSGGQPRHLLQFNAGVSGKGVGLQLSGNWRSASEYRLGQVPAPGDLRFAPRATLNLRLNAEVGTLLPGESWAKGLRLVTSVNNLFDSQQIVRDRNGATPLRYQPYLLDALGRTVAIGVRKIF